MSSSVRSKFGELFGGTPLVINSPGRINLIGEHTDYNNGFVMPAAINKGIRFAISRHSSDTSSIYSLKYDEMINIDHSKLERLPNAEWPNYLLGVLFRLKELGHDIPSFNCVFDGDLPTGSGLSSSAAMECGFVYALDQLFDLDLKRSDMIQIAQWAEHNYAGVKCGIMDQFASMMGKKDNAILLDCQSLEYHYFPIDLSDYQLLLCDSGVKHSLASSEYNTRRKECEQGVEILKNVFPLIRSLRNVSTAMVIDQKDRLPENVYKRCLYVTQEIARVLQAKEDLSHGRLREFGDLMFQTHGGLSRLYEVSCRELDFLVDYARQNSSVLGARMMGGGFGGSTLNIIKQSATEEFVQSLAKKYKVAFGVDLKTHVVTIADGTSVIEKETAVMTFDIREHSHRRLNVLTGEWVQVSPHRSKRPWQGQQEEVNETQGLSYDPTCYLCPGNKRSNGEVNPKYPSTFTFTNDFAAITNNVPEGSIDINGLILAKSERGICKVICFSPDHSLTIPEMDEQAISFVVREWMSEFKILSSDPNIGYIQIFENKGSIMGCSNPHPHGQIWAQESVPVEPRKKQFNQQKYYEQHGKTLLTDYVKTELEKNERIVFENEHFVSLVPFWAVWPFETMIIPRRSMQNILEMSDSEVASFAAAYKATTVKYDNLFETSFPYSAGLHQAPCDGGRHPEWHWHMSFYPPLLRSATVKKFMVGYEMLANPQRDISPEFSAERLRALPTTHYKQLAHTDQSK